MDHKTRKTAETGINEILLLKNGRKLSTCSKPQSSESRDSKEKMFQVCSENLEIAHFIDCDRSP